MCQKKRLGFAGLVSLALCLPAHAARLSTVYTDAGQPVASVSQSAQLALSDQALLLGQHGRVALYQATDQPKLPWAFSQSLAVGVSPDEPYQLALHSGLLVLARASGTEVYRRVSVDGVGAVDAQAEGFHRVGQLSGATQSVGLSEAFLLLDQRLYQRQGDRFVLARESALSAPALLHQDTLVGYLPAQGLALEFADGSTQRLLDADAPEFHAAQGLLAIDAGQGLSLWQFTPENQQLQRLALPALSEQTLEVLAVQQGRVLLLAQASESAEAALWLYQPNGLDWQRLSAEALGVTPAALASLSVRLGPQGMVFHSQGFESPQFLSYLDVEPHAVPLPNSAHDWQLGRFLVSSEQHVLLLSQATEAGVLVRAEAVSELESDDTQAHGVPERAMLSVEPWLSPSVVSWQLKAADWVGNRLILGLQTMQASGEVRYRFLAFAPQSDHWQLDESLALGEFVLAEAGEATGAASAPFSLPLLAHTSDQLAIAAPVLGDLDGAIDIRLYRLRDQSWQLQRWLSLNAAGELLGIHLEPRAQETGSDLVISDGRAVYHYSAAEDYALVQNLSVPHQGFGARSGWVLLSDAALGRVLLYQPTEQGLWDLSQSLQAPEGVSAFADSLAFGEGLMALSGRDRSGRDAVYLYQQGADSNEGYTLVDTVFSQHQRDEHFGAELLLSQGQLFVSSPTKDTDWGWDAGSVSVYGRLPVSERLGEESRSVAREQSSSSQEIAKNSVPSEGDTETQTLVEPAAFQTGGGGVGAVSIGALPLFGGMLWLRKRWFHGVFTQTNTQ